MLNGIPNDIGAVVLAAGRGTRLKCTDIPKVMKEIGGRPMVSYTVDMLKELGFPKDRIVLVVGFCREKVMQYFGDSVTYAVQEEQKGTAHAAYTGMLALPPQVRCALVMGGDDSSFYRAETLLNLVREHKTRGAALSLLSAEIERPESLGRVVRHPDGQIEIIEKEYLTEEQKSIREISTGTFCLDREWYEDVFPSMPPLRKLGEFGLPTALAMARQAGLEYQVVLLPNSAEWFGVNTSEELEEAQRRKATSDM